MREITFITTVVGGAILVSTTKGISSLVVAGAVCTAGLLSLSRIGQLVVE